MFITEEHYKRACIIATKIGATIGGSYIVHPDKANDIDMFLGKSAFDLWRAGRIPVDLTSCFEVAGVRFVDTWTDQREYYEANNYDNALACTYRSDDGMYNIIVVNDDFVPAFKASVLEMAARPELYQEKDARVGLHHSKREIIRQMLAEPAYAETWTFPPTR